MKISARHGNGQGFYTACRLVDNSCIISACDRRLDLSLDRLFLCKLEGSVKKLSRIDRPPVHKGNNSTLSELANLFVFGHIGKVCRRRGFNDDRIVGLDRKSVV